MLLNPKSHIFLMSCLGVASVQGQFRINEIDADTPGADTEEFVEIYRPDGTGDSLAGHALVFFDGSDSSDSVYLTIDLGSSSVDPAGFFIVAGLDVFGADLNFPGGPGMENDFIRNNTSAIAIYNGTTAADYLSGSLTTPVANGDLQDVVIHRVGTAEDATLASVFGAVDQPDEDENTSSAAQSIQRNPNGGSAFRIAEPTTRSTNTPLPEIQVLPSPVQFNEDDGTGATTILLTRGGDISEALDVDIAVTPFLEAALRLSVPLTASFGEDEDTTSFEIDSIPNSSVDGDFIFEITVSEIAGGPGSEPRYQNGSGVFVLKDDDVSSPTLVINELLRKSDGGVGPEFVEIYNGSGTIDLTNYRLVFYGADPDEDFGTSQLEVIIDGGTIGGGGYFTIGNSELNSIYSVMPDQEESGLNIPDGDITVVLFNSSGGIEYVALMQDDEQDAIPNSDGIALAADILVGQDDGDNPAGYFLTENGGEISQILENVAGDQAADSATPGSSNTISPTLFLSRDQELIEEDSTGAITFTVTRVPDTTGDLVVAINNTDSTEIWVPESVTILDGETSASFAGTPQTDGTRDGIQSASIEVSATAHISDTIDIAVLDADIPDLAPCDLAFIASISAGDDNVFAFVTLTEIFSGTRISLTDRGWKAGGGFLAGEDEIKWLAITDVPAGTVVTFTNNVPDVGTASSGEINLSDSGDQIFAYQGSDSNPTLIAGMHMNGAWDADATDIHTSALPTALATTGAVAIDPEQNNAVYTGSSSDPLSVLKVNLFSAASFTAGNDSAAAGSGLIPDFFEILEEPPYSVSVEGISLSGGQVAIDFTASRLSDVYVSTNLQSWSLATDGGEVESGTYTDSSPPTGKAFYLIQEAGTEAP